MTYPTISLFLKHVLDININLPIQTFGFFVATAFITASYILSKELKRKEEEGHIEKIKKQIFIGKPLSTIQIVSYCFFTYIVSFKIWGIILEYDVFMQNPQSYIASIQGNTLFGIITTFILFYKRYSKNQKKLLKKPKLTTLEVHAFELVGNITTIAAVSGIIGAKLFHSLQYFDEFKADPVGQLLSFSGLTFYGGFIFAAISVLWYIKKNNIKTKIFIDAIAPALMIAYGIGRMGCQFSGDGDWGIVNTKIKPEWLPIPEWMWSYNFPHNVIKRGELIPGCNPVEWDGYCYQLTEGVFPTALYEVIISFLMFLVIWRIRKIFKPGVLFCIYLVFNGIERFSIEIIRVTEKYSVIGLNLTQAQMIAIMMIIIGIFGIIKLNQNNQRKKLKIT